MRLTVGDWEVRPREGLIRQGGIDYGVRPRAMAVLTYLAERPGDVVSNDELVANIWAPAVVSDDAVMGVVSELRRALGDDPKHPSYIARIPKLGYQLVAKVGERPPPRLAQFLADLEALERPFPAYVGDEPYTFVCYSHADKTTVYPELTALRDAGINLWYDEGIEVGSTWTEEIAQAISRCQQMLFFVSPDSANSDTCRAEVEFALAAPRQKPVLVVYLEPTTLPEGLELVLGRRQALLRYEFSEDDYKRKLLAALTGQSAAYRSAEPRSPRRLWGLLGFAAMVLAVFGAFVAQQMYSPGPDIDPNAPPRPDDVLRTTLDLPHAGPDGPRFVVLAANVVVYDGYLDDEHATLARRLDSFEVVRIAEATGRVRRPSLSYDGEWFLYFDLEDAHLKKVKTDGTSPSPTVVADTGLPVSSIAFSITTSWGPEGAIVVQDATHAGLRILGPDGTLQNLTNPAEGYEHSRPWFFNGEEALTMIVSAPDGRKHLAVYDLATGETTEIVEASWGEVFGPFIIYGWGTTAMAARFDRRTFEVTSDAAALPRTGYVHGRDMLYGVAESRPRTMVWTNPDGSGEVDVGLPSGNYNGPRLSPDGRYIAYRGSTPSTAAGTSYGIHLFELATQQLRTIVEDHRLIQNMAWSPDSTSIAYGAGRERQSIHVIDIEPGSQPDLFVPAGDDHVYVSYWSQDGTSIALNQILADNDGRGKWTRVAEHAADSGELVRSVIDIPGWDVIIGHPAVSPNGRWIAYTTYEPPETRIAIQPYPDGRGERHLIPWSWKPAWAPDGKRIYFRAHGKADIAYVDVLSENPLTVSDEQLAFQARQYPHHNDRNWDVAPDGRMLLVRQERSARKVVLVRNWMAEVDRLVPPSWEE